MLCQECPLGFKATMKPSLAKAVFVLLFSVPTMLSPSLAWENNWGDDYNYNRGWNNQNYNQARLESIQYNGRIIRTGIRPNTDICSLVKYTLNQNHCDGYIGFDERARTHIFRNYSHQQDYPNNQWDNQQQYRNWSHPTPTWNRRGGCVYQNKHVRILCN